jgi:hypothetical protein
MYLKNRKRLELRENLDVLQVACDVLQDGWYYLNFLDKI